MPLPPGFMDFVVLRSKGPPGAWAPSHKDLKCYLSVGYTAAMLLEVKDVLDHWNWHQPLARAIELAQRNKEPSLGKCVPMALFYQAVN